LIIKDGNQLICLYDIYTIDKNNNYVFMFPPDSGLDIDKLEKSIKDKYLAKIAEQEQSPLLYSIFFNANEKEMNYTTELSAKLFEAALTQYQNNDLLAKKFAKFKNTYLHIFIYMILYCDFPHQVRQIIRDFITKLIEITNLQTHGFTNLFVYLKMLITKYAPFDTFDQSKIPIGKKIKLTIKIPNLTDTGQMLSEDLEICKLFITKFETDYKSSYSRMGRFTIRRILHSRSNYLPEITKLEPNNGIFAVLF
jgi:hypothetical protein